MKITLTILIVSILSLFVWQLRVTAAPASPLAGESIELVAAVLILEAGGESDARAMPAVLEVIRNRKDRRKGWTMKQVVTQRKQFSRLNDISPEKAIELAKRHPKWGRALQLVTGGRTNFVGKCDHYFARYIRRPDWSRWPAEERVIGNHIFIRLPAKHRELVIH